MNFDIYTAPNGAFEGRADWLLFHGENMRPDENCLAALTALIDASEPEFAAFEPRTLPCENGKYYDPVTLETERLGACFAVRRDAFRDAGGFDGLPENADAAAELSNRLRAKGYKLRYAPAAIMREDTHEAKQGEAADETQPDLFVRTGADYAHTPPERKTRFTVVIRTYQRPDVLRLTLESLRWQTYDNFAVIVVEDGETPVSEAAVREAEKWLDVTYLPANEHWGRCRAGNEGVARAATEYVCFLDDDDYFFAEHLEVMARAIEDHPECGLWCAMSVEGRCGEGVRADFRAKTNMGKKNLRAIDFCFDNPVPIQAVVFRKAVYEACGGLDPEMDALEDWDLWLRMICRAPVAGVAKATSIYRVPADFAVYQKRRETIEKYRLRLFERMGEYMPPVSARDTYELYWRVYGAPKELDPLIDHAAWYEKARAMRDSKLWKLTAPLRRVCAAISRFFDHASGPAPDELDWNDASAWQLCAYCQKVERSVFWKIFAPLRRGQK